MVQAFTGAQANLEVEKGGRISLMNGHVTGGFIELVRYLKHNMFYRHAKVSYWDQLHVRYP